jgi:hypothetical protein
MEKSAWQDNFDGELAHAQAARASGNEGMARVCARRAVGILIGEYLRLRGISYAKPSAYDRIKYLLDLDSVPVEAQRVLAHFLLRIDTDHNLPLEVDLIGEARWLSETLIPGASIADRSDDGDHRSN